MFQTNVLTPAFVLATGSVPPRRRAAAAAAVSPGACAESTRLEKLRTILPAESANSSRTWWLGVEPVLDNRARRRLLALRVDSRILRRDGARGSRSAAAEIILRREPILVARLEQVRRR